MENKLIIFFVIILSLTACQNPFEVEKHALNSLSHVPQHKPRLADRFYINNVLSSIFLPKRAPNPGDPEMATYNAIKKRIENRSLIRPTALGGPCHETDRIEGHGKRDCSVNLGTTKAKVLSNSSVIRKGWLIRACQDTLALQHSLKNALNNAGLKVDSPVTKDNVKRVYKLFYPTREPSIQTLKDLIGVHRGVASTESKPKVLESWRFIMNTVCISQRWTVL